jgi:hypothetical protein
MPPHIDRSHPRHLQPVDPGGIVCAAVVFETKPIAFALRDVVPGTDLASVAQPFTFADPDGYQVTLHDRA